MARKWIHSCCIFLSVIHASQIADHSSGYFSQISPAHFTHPCSDPGHAASSSICMQAVADSATASWLPSGQCELLYGNAGLLYAGLFLQQSLGGSSPHLAAVRQKLVTEILAAGLHKAQHGSPEHQMFGLMWSWHDTEYLGGRLGICH